MILPLHCAVTRCRNMAETAERRNASWSHVVTAHIIELRAGDWGGNACWSRPWRTCTTQITSCCQSPHATGVIA